MLIRDYAIKFAAPARWILILGIVATALNTARNLIYLPETSATSTIRGNAPTKTTTKSKAVDVNALADLHLFGKPARDDNALPKSVANAQATRLPLELKAVFAASENAISAAIIGQRGQRAKLYAVGESVPGNAVLAEVYSQQVLLRRAGKLESLAFPESTYRASSSSPGPVLSQSDSGLVRNRQQAEQRPISRPTPEDVTAQSEFAQEVEKVTQQLMADPGKGANELGLTAHSSGGYKVGAVANSPYLQTAGLKAGDIIFSINGTPMGNVKNNKAMLAELMAGGRARLEVMRNNQRFVITASLPTSR